MILILADLLTTTVHLVPSHAIPTTLKMADLFLENIFCYHRLPTGTMSDWRPPFISHFWWEFLRLLGIEPLTSSAYLPQTYGQTERVNQILEQYLHCFLNYHQDNWFSLLSCAEFAYRMQPMLPPNKAHSLVTTAFIHVAIQTHPCVPSTCCHGFDHPPASSAPVTQGIVVIC